MRQVAQPADTEPRNLTYETIGEIGLITEIQKSFCPGTIAHAIRHRIRSSATLKKKQKNCIARPDFSNQLPFPRSIP
jgi:hypothetical protein